MSASRRSFAKNEAQLRALMTLPGNELCADCRSRQVQWASWSLGIFLCMRCAGFHRKMGTHISKVKSISLDSWQPYHMENMKNTGNIKSNAFFNPDPLHHPMPVGCMNDDQIMERYIRDKYERKSFQVQDSSRHSSRNKSSSACHSNKHLSGQSDYVKQLFQLKEMGFSNSAKNLEILSLKKGDLPSTIEILVALQNCPPVSTESQSWNPFDESATLRSSTQTSSTLNSYETVRPPPESTTHPLNPFIPSPNGPILLQPCNPLYNISTNINFHHHNLPKNSFAPSQFLYQQPDLLMQHQFPPQSQTNLVSQASQVSTVLHYYTNSPIPNLQDNQQMGLNLPLQQQGPNQPPRKQVDKEAIMSLFNKPYNPNSQASK